MLDLLGRELMRSAIDLAPIVLILGFLWMRFLRADRSITRRVLIGALHLAAGLTLFRIGLEGALLPPGSELAVALGERSVARGDALSFTAVVGFAVALGGTTALIEPMLVATADRVRDLSGGAVRPMVPRVAVATRIGLGRGGVGVTRLILGIPIGLMCCRPLARRGRPARPSSPPHAARGSNPSAGFSASNLLRTGT